MKQIIKQVLQQRWLLIVVCLLCVASSAYGRKSWEDNQTYFDARFDNSDGSVVIKLRSGVVNFIDWYDAHIDYLSVSFGNDKLFDLSSGSPRSITFKNGIANGYFIVESKGKQQLWKSSDGERTLSLGGNGDYYDMWIRYYPSSKPISPSNTNAMDVTISGRWEISNPYGGDGMHGTRSISLFQLSSVALDNVKLNIGSNLTELYVTKQGTAGMDKQGSYKLLYENGNPVENAHDTVYNNTFGFAVKEVADVAKSYKVQYVYTNKNRAEWSITSSVFKVPAYIRPHGLNLEFDDIDKKINVSWQMSAVGGTAGVDYYDYPFIVQRVECNNSGAPIDNNWITLSADVVYESFKSAYTFVDESFVDKSISKIYRYRVKRNDGCSDWIDNFYVSDKVSVSTLHYDVDSVSVDLDSTGISTLHWSVINLENGIWSTGSKFCIDRVNKGMNTRERIELKKDDLLKGYYVDRFINKCNVYYYELSVSPGGHYELNNALATNAILFTELGTVKNLTASKGYFSDRTELQWEANGGFDRFVIERKVHNSSDDTYQQIKTEESSASVLKYTVKDENGLPGEVYDYRVYGVLVCGDSLMKTPYLTEVGFRTPTGDIYGSVSFDGGQAESNVLVYLEGEVKNYGKSLQFTGNSEATIPSGILINKVDSVTLQCWIKPSTQTPGKEMMLIQKANMYELGLDAVNHLYFKVGNVTLTADSTLSQLHGANTFVHVTGVFDGNRSYIYYNGLLIASRIVSTKPVANSNPVILGNGYSGLIDEVRLWTTALDSTEIVRDYGRYLLGNETGLVAYYPLNYNTDTCFYDMSYTQATYHRQNGYLLNGVTLSTDVPTPNQLGYKAVSGVDGSYAIRGVPYFGNSTAYTIVPQKGVHTFEPNRAIRALSAGTQTHTVDFVDKSTFTVNGKVQYKDGTYPVKDCTFRIDGVSALQKNGMPVMSDADGSFTLLVPVGQHEVKVEKLGHTFVDGGRILNELTGQDYNYQDNMGPIKLSDETKIRFIGRVGGGTIQEAYPLGHSLSKNNLSSNLKVTLLSNSDKPAIHFVDSAYEDTIAHFLPSNCDSTKLHYTRVHYYTDKIEIYPDTVTGEFFADIYPESYKSIGVEAKGHTYQIPTAEAFDASNAVNELTDVYSYVDSVLVDDSIKVAQSYNDTVRYEKMKKFIYRTSPTISVVQVNNQLKPLDYFGLDSVSATTALESLRVPLFQSDSGVYTFGKPVFSQNTPFLFKVSLFEGYAYNGNGVVDAVPTQDASITVSNDLALRTDTTFDLNEEGFGYYDFNGREPELTSASGNISIQAKYGSSTTPIHWLPNGNTGAFNCFLLGTHQTGTDFITAGPDKVLTVLRDPPGSNSYSYLEKGVTFNESSSYQGSVKNEGSESTTIGAKAGIQVVTIAGVGIMTGTVTDLFEAETGTTLGITHEEEYTGTDTKKYSTTMTTRYQTSADPLYVGADGDVYIGYSTNLTFGSTQNVTIIPRAYYDSCDAVSREALSAYALSPNWVMVKKNGVNVNPVFKTVFAYPQVHIETVLIPKIESMILSQFQKADGYTDVQLRAMVDADTTLIFYRSRIPLGDAAMGDTGTYDVIYHTSNLPIEQQTVSYADTIALLKQSIADWEARIGDNEKAKIEAKLLQNYSFQAGAQVEYSEAYSTNVSHESSFHIMLGGKITTEVSIGTTATKTDLQIDETVSTTQGGTFASEAERSHTKGFVLAESGDDDYLTVDVCREKGWSSGDEHYHTGVVAGMVDSTDVGNKDYYSSFVFRTQGGVTSCPFEDAYVSKYYQPGTVISKKTMQLEVPNIGIDKTSQINVPSGEPAYFTLKLRNNSETGEDVWFYLMVDDQANPDGAVMAVDGTAIGGFRLEYLVPAGQELLKTLTVSKGKVLNYDNLQLVLMSQCQADPTDFLPVIADTVTFSVHFIPSCSDVTVKKPTDNWVYNTKLPEVTDTLGKSQKYLNVTISKFNVNYSDFDHIELQRKESSESDEEWVAIENFYNDSTSYLKAIADGKSAKMIDPADQGEIVYGMMMDDKVDQRYDLRAASVCVINELPVYNYSPVVSGIKDVYCPRLFGAAQPANGILTVNDEIRLNFNEPIASGILAPENFQVTGVRNGSQMEHSTSITLDGQSSGLSTEFDRNFVGKDLTFEMWMKENQAQNATLFAHGDVNSSIKLSISNDQKLHVTVNGNTISTLKAVPVTMDSWSHVALVYEAAGYVSVYFDYAEVIPRTACAGYNGKGRLMIGESVNGDEHFQGNVQNARLWSSVRTMSQLQLNSNVQLSGTEPGLLAYYPMNEGKGAVTEDKARGAHLLMNNCEWSLPAGYAAHFDGKSGYLTIGSGSAVALSDMNYSLEFWFKSDGAQRNATMLANGRGDGQDPKSSFNNFAIGFDNNGILTYWNDSIAHPCNGQFDDQQWHHFVMTVSRTTGFAQMYLDGTLNSFFKAEELGGIVGDSMSIGARRYYDPIQLTVAKVDNFFGGKIDELRFWELNKTQPLIEAFNNEKLNGNEMGLLFYYPFESWNKSNLNTNYLKSTLKNQLANAKDSALIHGVVAMTLDKAPVKDKGPVADLNFSFVVNNDALIINLLEPKDRIEKTIVTFTANDIRDLNGNSILSPITWSAYIDRNQLRWSDEVMNVTKPVYEPLTITAKAVNMGGSIQNYTISNQPSWLTIEPVSGSLAPTKSQEIVMTVDPGLNVGTYNEVIYLTNDENVSEALELNLTVEGEKPDWDVNSADYKYSMSVFGKLRINNIFSTDKNDIIGVFQNGKCIGKTNCIYDKNLDLWYVMLTIYNNSVQSSGLSYRIWDASTNVTYQGMPDVDFIFRNNAIVGNPGNPVIFDAKEITYQTLHLNQGWNWISYNLANDLLSDVNSTLIDGKWSKSDIVKTLSKSDSYSEKQSKWIGSLSSHGGFNNREMYWISSSKAQDIPVSGSSIDTLTLQIKGNAWNPISYIPSINLPVKSALANYNAQEGDVVKNQDAFAMFYNNNWIGSLQYMEPGKGYMLRNTSSDNKTLNYPSASASLMATPRQKNLMKNANSYNENLTVVAVCDDWKQGDKLLAYVNGDYRGEAQVVTFNGTDSRLFITVMGTSDNVSQDVMFVKESVDNQRVSSSTVLPYYANTMYGTVDQPIEIKFEEVSSSINIYPIPYDQYVYVSGSVDEVVPVSIKFIDAAGKVVLQTASVSVQENGTFQTSFQTSALPQGVYLIKIEQNGKLLSTHVTIKE